jgi:hypothetical protein
MGVVAREAGQVRLFNGMVRHVIGVNAIVARQAIDLKATTGQMTTLAYI